HVTGVQTCALPILPSSIFTPATMLLASIHTSASSASSRSRRSFGSSLPPSYQAATNGFHSRSTTARSVSTRRLPRMLANRSWPLDAKPAMARPLPWPSCCTSTLSAEVKNQIGERRSSLSAVIGRAWPSSWPSRPSITVRSFSSAFQNFSSSSWWSVISRLRQGEAAFKHRRGESHVGAPGSPAAHGGRWMIRDRHPYAPVLDQSRHRRLDGLGHPARHPHPPDHHPVARQGCQGRVALAVRGADGRVHRLHRLQLDARQLGVHRHQLADPAHRGDRPGGAAAAPAPGRSLSGLSPI